MEQEQEAHVAGVITRVMSLEEEEVGCMEGFLQDMVREQERSAQ